MDEFQDEIEITEIVERRKPLQVRNCTNYVINEKAEDKENRFFNPADDFIFENQRRLLPCLWEQCKIEKVERLPYDIDGDCVYELSYDRTNLMSSSRDGRSWRIRHSSKRSGFRDSMYFGLLRTQMHQTLANMAEVGHSRNAVRGAKNDTLARVAEDHIVESALIKAKLESYEDGSYHGGRCASQKRKDEITLRRQLDRAAQFAKDDNAGKSRVDDNEKKKWVINLSNKKLSDDETSVLAKGMNFAVVPKRIPVDQFIAETESSISSLSPDKKSAIRNKVCSILSCAKPPKKNISQAEMKALKTIGKDKNIIILKADKGNSTVVMNRTEYDEKIEVMLSDSKTYQVLQSDPAKKCENKLKALISGYKDNIPDSIKRRISTTDGNTSRFYGLPKIHKQGIPLRPIRWQSDDDDMINNDFQHLPFPPAWGQSLDKNGDGVAIQFPISGCSSISVGLHD
ncbi:hypothetical protein QZH41_005703 [Actinostola sp. cb2023]|nr:hypothetical protein QZH41_005703 [Actinostola sp. cb2023]